ncbi:MAG: TIGR03084 family metal-binding protein, partial [Pseudomonadota bacterium]
ERVSHSSALLADLPEGDWIRKTQFNDWTLQDVIVHLHFWNLAADLSLTQPTEFKTHIQDVLDKIPTLGFRQVENEYVHERGPALFSAWRSHFADMAQRWFEVNPKLRVDWAGPSMSARSSITARQMETWAHGQEAFDLLGVTREDGDRLRNIVYLGVNTFAWSHQVQGFDVPDQLPAIRLKSPTGETWEHGDSTSQSTITGSATEFAQVVTQTRNVEDTRLAVEGDIALRWMRTAQCFAGPKETPPRPGTRFKVA